MVTRFPVSTLPREMISLRSAVDRLFNESLVPGLNEQSSLVPINVYGTPDEYVVMAAVPGLDAEDVDITVQKNVVHLSGSLPSVSNQDNGATWYVKEMQSGSFERTLTLPTDLDASRAEATVQNGILELHIPKAESEKPRRIQAQSQSNKAVQAPEVEVHSAKDNSSADMDPATAGR